MKTLGTCNNVSALTVKKIRPKTYSMITNYIRKQNPLIRDGITVAKNQ